MFAPDQYELLDFGHGRKLERLGPRVLDRPCPAAELVAKADPGLWREADARYERTSGVEGIWFVAGQAAGGMPRGRTSPGAAVEKTAEAIEATTEAIENTAGAIENTAEAIDTAGAARAAETTEARGALEAAAEAAGLGDAAEAAGLTAVGADWIVRHDRLTMQLKLTPFGHVGCFPEQAENWDWLDEQVRAAERPLNVLNLFGYTGGSTLAAAAAGASAGASASGGEGACVTHVDAAKNIVAWARRNARLSGLAERPIRWLVEDVQKFAKREVLRGNRYDALILDPPSYGRGPRGEVFRAAKHLAPLLRTCGVLTEHRPALVLLTCHTPGLSAKRLARMVAELVMGDRRIEPQRGTMHLTTAGGRKLESGVFVRWTGER